MPPCDWKPIPPPPTFFKLPNPRSKRDEIVNSLILGVAQGLRQSVEPVTPQPYLSTLSDGDQVRAVGVMTPPYPLMLYVVDPAQVSILAAMAADLHAQKWTVSGVNGPAPLSQAFAELWSKETGRTAHLMRHMGLYELHAVILPDPAPGSMRLAVPADQDLLAAWTLAFQQEALPQETPTDSSGIVERSIARQALYVWEDGMPVSMSAKVRPTERGVSVSMVYTPPTQRGKGYASNIVAHLSRRLLDEGYHYCTLYTDMTNPTSNSIYQKIGYRPVVDFYQYAFETKD